MEAKRKEKSQIEYTAWPGKSLAQLLFYNMCDTVACAGELHSKSLAMPLLHTPQQCAKMTHEETFHKLFFTYSHALTFDHFTEW